MGSAIFGTWYGLLKALYPVPDVRVYFHRLRSVPETGMRRVQTLDKGYVCWLFEDQQWKRQQVLTDLTDAKAWWLGDPWLPNGAFLRAVAADADQVEPGSFDEIAGFRSLSDAWALEGEGAVPGAGASPDASGEPAEEPLARAWPGYAPRGSVLPDADAAGWTPRRWEEASIALAFHIVMETGARTHDVGPESTETAGHVYQRLRSKQAAAQVHWYEGRSRHEELRASCPVRTDIDPMLRCVVLAEAMVVLQRRPHAAGYIGISYAPRGVAAEAADVLGKFGLPAAVYGLLSRLYPGKRADRRPAVGCGAYPVRYVGVRGAAGTLGPGGEHAARAARLGGGRERRRRAGRGAVRPGLAAGAQRDHDRARGRACPGLAAQRTAAGRDTAARRHLGRDPVPRQAGRAWHGVHRARRVHHAAAARRGRGLAAGRAPRDRAAVAAAPAAVRDVPGDTERLRRAGGAGHGGGCERGDVAGHGPGAVRLRVLRGLVPAARRGAAGRRAVAVPWPRAASQPRARPRAQPPGGVRCRPARPADRRPRRRVGSAFPARLGGRAAGGGAAAGSRLAAPAAAAIGSVSP